MSQPRRVPDVLYDAELMPVESGGTWFACCVGRAKKAKRIPDPSQTLGEQPRHRDMVPEIGALRKWHFEGRRPKSRYTATIIEPEPCPHCSNVELSSDFSKRWIYKCDECGNIKCAIDLNGDPIADKPIENQFDQDSISSSAKVARSYDGMGCPRPERNIDPHLA